MDILSHGLWGVTLVRRKKLIWWALLAGMAPDILGSGSAFIYLLTIGKFWGTGTWQYLPEWTKEMYRFQHSLVAAALYWLILVFANRDYELLIVPYLFHILIDAFTHADNVVGRLLYPVESGVSLHGLNWWEHWWIMAANGLALLGVNIFWWTRRRQSRFRALMRDRT